MRRSFSARAQLPQKKPSLQHSPVDPPSAPPPRRRSGEAGISVVVLTRATNPGGSPQIGWPILSQPHRERVGYRAPPQSAPPNPQFHIHPFLPLQVRNHAKQVLRARIPARSEHPLQARGRNTCRLRQLRKSNRRIDVIAQDSPARYEIAVVEEFTPFVARHH